MVVSVAAVPSATPEPRHLVAFHRDAPLAASSLCVSPPRIHRLARVHRFLREPFASQLAARIVLGAGNMTSAPPSNAALCSWVQNVAAHAQPSRIHWCDGSEEERTLLEREMVTAGSLLELDAKQHPRSFLHRSDPTDVARTEHLTFISTPREVDAGPTNNWMSREDAEQRVWPLFAGAMKGRTLYVAEASETAIGFLPREDALDLSGMDFPRERLSGLLAVDGAAWLQEAGRTLEFLGRFGAQLPRGLLVEHRALVKRVHESLH